MEEKEIRTEARPKSSVKRTRSPQNSGKRPAASRPASSGVKKQRPVNSKGRVPKKSRRSRKRKRNLVIRIAIITVAVLFIIGLLIFWKKYGSSNEMADLKKYYNVQQIDDLAVVVNDQAIGRLEERGSGGKIYDGIPYVEYTVVRDFINSWFYWDHNENVLLYTLPNGSVSVEVGGREYTNIKDKVAVDYTILKTEGKTAYIALPFIQQYTNMEYELFVSDDENIPTRVVVECDWGEHTFATMKRDTAVRFQGGVKSPIMTEVKKSDKVRVIDDEDDWMKIRTEDGYFGYVKTNSLKRQKKEVTSRDFVSPEYSNISVDHIINLAWHNVDNTVANGYVLETIARTKGLTTIAPTWFSVDDVSGNIYSIADSDYVNYAHQSGIEVWGVLRDFHGGINSYDETLELLSYTSRRDNLINQVVAEALKTGLDGINVDFELVSTECGEHYIQFIRELSVKCRQNGLILSVNNYVPMPYNEHYRMDEQAIVADYIIMMGYDEHNTSSLEAGSVASYDYVEQGIEDSLKVVPRSKLICGVPFYTRLWHETPKSEEELAEQAGTEAADYPNNVTSEAYGMDAAEDLISSVGVDTVWDDNTKQYYAEWEGDDGIYKIWLEEEESLTEKLKVIKSNNLAGVASWRLGWEKSGIWDLILQYVN